MTGQNGQESGLPRRYAVIETDQAQAERENAFLFLLPLVGPQFAQEWYDGLLLAIAELPQFPGPLSHARDEEASAHYGYEVRRMLYHGPSGKRRARTPYRVLFTLLPPAEGEDETIIRILRVLHGA